MAALRNRSGRSELSQSEQQRLAQLLMKQNGCANVFRRWNPFLMQTSELEGSLMAGINLNKKLWLFHSRAWSVASAPGLPTILMTSKTGAYPGGAVDFLRSGAVTLVAYIILSFALDPMPDNMALVSSYLPAVNCWMKSTVNWGK